MPGAWDILQIITIILATVAMVVVVRLRRRQYHEFLEDFSDQEVCEHLKGALAALKTRGHRVVRAGQKSPEMPLEIHLTPPFDPQALADELKLQEPVFISRNALCCREDECELHGQ